ncbi:hypothetical protein BLNAU_23960 [Blattamonas nauphoetae]|uniref:Uncharacterized protein n=1 Tax=Blattamonas nauphoetae TaxID=2049346 RepID=A0ABQ9WNR6_9EUKA|nr:hypothetical protein BLNAU_23960 [Blattamonas nauphoetae]
MAADGIIHRFISSEEAISIDTPVPQAIYDEGSLSISSYRGGYIGKTMKQFSDPVAEAEGRPEELEVNADCSFRQDESTNYPICVVNPDVSHIDWACLTSIIDDWNINNSLAYRTSILRCTGVWPGDFNLALNQCWYRQDLNLKLSEVFRTKLKSILTRHSGSIKYELDNQNRSLNRQFPQDDPQPRPQALIDKMTPANK